MYRVHKYDLEQGGRRIVRVSVCLFEPGAITWIYQIYLYWWQESSGQIITAVQEGHWLEDVHKYAAHGKQTAIILYLFLFQLSSLMLVFS